jgi:4a-hydroxytetrahydrobiopterin dehydratase
MTQSNADLDRLASTTLEIRVVEPDTLRDNIAALGARWSIANDELVLVLRGQPMSRHVPVVAQAAKLADELDHHPRIVLEYPGLTVSLHTHDAKAITRMDVVYAARLEQWLRVTGV